MFRHKEKLLFKIKKGKPIGVNIKELSELGEFVKGKTIEDVEWWGAGSPLAPTFIFTDGTSVEFYFFSGYMNEYMKKISKSKPSISWCLEDGKTKEAK